MKSLNAAETKPVNLATQLDEVWVTLRWYQKDNPLKQLLGNAEYEPSTAPLISEAKDIYLHSKREIRPPHLF